MSRHARLLAVAATVLGVALIGGLLFETNRNTDPTPADEPTGFSITESLRRIPGEAATFGDLRVAGADLVALETLTGIERSTTPGDSTDEWFSLVSGEISVDATRFGIVVPRSELFREGLFDPAGWASATLQPERHCALSVSRCRLASTQRVERSPSSVASISCPLG